LSEIDQEIAFAKINLALHVRRRREDGYHELETLFAFAEDGDILRVEPGEGVTLALEGPFAAAIGDAGEDNLVLRAANALRAAFAIREGVALHLDKRLPVAAGIGGGSADAAAALRLLARRWKVPLHDARLHSIAAGLGADVPACLLSRAVRGEGVGERLERIDEAGLKGMPLLLVNPGVPLATGPVFKAWDGVDRGALETGNPLVAARDGRNDLEPPARGLVPVIAEIVALLAAQPGVLLARMSGSGATCFALFESDVARDAAYAAAERPGWWRLATKLR
jgi:4-diphosphocytidyl-2-C-methyl-D-erythritol kinase